MGKVEIRTKKEYDTALLLKQNFPNLANGYENGSTLRQIAENIINFDNPRSAPFSNFSLETLTKYVRIVLKGGLFLKSNLTLEGLMSEQDYEDIFSFRKAKICFDALVAQNIYTPWNDFEVDFLVEKYQDRFTPKEIYIEYLTQDDFTPRTFNSIESKIIELRKREKIGYQRVFWDNEIGTWALYLLEKYGKDKGFCVVNARTLDEYFFEGMGEITPSKLNNFYRREDKKNACKSL